MANIDLIRAVKRKANGQWQGILSAVGADLPVNTHTACPGCGGKDRFRFDDKDGNGTFICNQCGAGDGLALVQRVLGVGVTEAAKEVAGIIGIDTRSDHLPASERIQVKTQQENHKATQQQYEARDATERLKLFTARYSSLLSQVQQGESVYLAGKGLTGFMLPLLPDGSILIPLMNATGTVTGAQVIKPDGGKRLLTNSTKKGSYYPVNAPECVSEVIIAEGLATALTCHLIRPDALTVAAMDAGNLIHIAEVIRGKYPAVQITIAADNDADNTVNTGREKAEAAARAVNGQVTIPATSGDWNDVYQAEGLNAAEQAFNQGMYEVQGEAEMTPSVVIKLDDHREKERDPLKPFVDSRENGIYYVTPKVDKDSGEIMNHEQWLSDAMQVIGRGRDDIEFYLIIRWTEDGTTYTEAVKTGDVGDREGWRQLKAAGLNIATKPFLRNVLADWLQRCAKKTDWHITHSTGWQHGAYIFPTGEVIGTPDKSVIFCGRTSSVRGYTVSGTAESWRDSVAALARGNPFMMLSVAAALASPVIGLLRDDGFGVHFYDQSTAGKTTSQSVGCSVFGEPSAMRLTWFATTLGLINEAAAHNNNLLPLDEVGQGSSVKDVAAASYALFNGKGKLQGAKGGGNRDILQFKTIAISTGEVDLDTFVRGEGRKLKAGQLVRLLNIPFSSPDVLHGFQDARDHAKAIEKAIADNHGAAGRAWCTYLTQHRQTARAAIDEAKIRWNGLIPKGAGAQVPRVAERFAILEGALIAGAHLTGWTAQESRDAIQHCFNAWVAEFGIANKEHQQIREQTEAFLDRFGLSRYAPEPYTYDHAAISNLAGYRKDTGDTPNNGGKIHFYTFPDVFETEISERFEPKMFARVLAESGMLKKAANGGFKVQGMKHNGSPRKYYVVMYAPDEGGE